MCCEKCYESGLCVIFEHKRETKIWVELFSKFLSSISLFKCCSDVFSFVGNQLNNEDFVLF